MARTHQQGTETSQHVRADESAARASEDTHLADAAVDVKNPTETEAALAQTVRLLEYSLESQAGTILFSIDAEYRYLYFNKAHADVMKAAYAAEPKIGLNILELISSDEDRAIAKENYDRALAGESHSNVRVFGDAERAYYESFFNPILDDHGAVIGATGMARDITERKQAEEALREREYLLSASQRAAHVGTWSWKVGDTNTYWSDETYRLYGLSPDMGPPDSEFFFDIVHPEDRPKMREYPEALIAGSQPPPVEFRILRTDGIYRWIRTEGDVIETVDGVPTRIAGTAYDVTERKQAEARLKLIADASEAFAEVVDSATMLDRVAIRVSEVVGGSCWVRLLSDDQEWLDVAVLRDTDPQTQEDAYAILSQQRQPVADSGIASKVFLSGDPELIPVVSLEQLRSMSPQRLRPLFERFAMHSVVAAALRVHGRSIGVMGVTRSRSDQPAFTPEDMSLVQDLADRAAMAIWNAQLLERQERHLQTIAGSLSSMIEVVTSVVEARDPYTAGHERRVSELAVRIAAEMGMSAEQVEDIRIASLVHDVGKVSVPAEILSKPGRLSEIEFSLIKGHSQAGYEILSLANMERDVAEMVYQHHERCDGSGYPRGLSEGGLLEGAKVLAVADVVEAMVSHGPYRAGLGVDAALAEIERGAGLQYDASVSKACVRLFREGDFEFSAP